MHFVIRFEEDFCLDIIVRIMTFLSVKAHLPSPLFTGHQQVNNNNVLKVNSVEKVISW